MKRGELLFGTSWSIVAGKYIEVNPKEAFMVKKIC